MGSDARGREADDRGAVVVIVAAAIGAILLMVATVLDFSGARRDRDADQVAADTIALAASQSLGTANLSAAAACGAAVDYLLVNLPTTPSTSADLASQCTTQLSAPCTSATPAREVSIAVAEYTITLTHPVPDGSPLLAGQASSTLDGTACQRFGVRVQQTRDNLWGAGSVSLDVDAVGRFIPGVGDVHAPLILLADHECEVLEVGGSSQLTVSTSTGEPGYVAIDSDGDECGNKVVLDISGADPNGKVIADTVSMWALNTANASVAYNAGLLSPSPVASSAPVGRSAFDWRYNCDPSAGCPGTGPAYLDELVTAWGGTGMPTELSWLPGAFTQYPAAGESCTPPGNVIFPAGNWYIACGTTGLKAGGNVTFLGGNVVSDGPLDAAGAQGLRINCEGGALGDNVTLPPCEDDPTQFEPAVFFQRSGDLVNTNDSRALEMRQTFVYLQAGGLTTAGNHMITWTAPDDPTHPFDDLLLWTETTADIKITGTVDLELEGTLFAPNATVELTGSTGAEALRAQIVASQLDLSGTATLELSPEIDRMTTVGKGRPVLIR